MKKQNLFDQFAHSSASIKIATIAVITVWGMVFAALTGCTVWLVEQRGLALQPTPGAGIPTIVLAPTVAQEGTWVTVRGEAWNAGSTVLIYVAAPGETSVPSYALASSVADAEGRFITSFAVPSGAGWENQGMATVTAQVAGGGASARAFLNVTSPATTEVAVEPTASAAEGPGGTPTETATPSVAEGPSGTPTSQSEEATATAPPVPAATPTSTPTPTPTPVPVIVDTSYYPDWRGEYWSNPDLSGAPALVRNDVALDFDWGTGSPASGLPADNFSARWTGTWTLSDEGLYRLHLEADDGVRLWVDDTLIIDQWWDGGREETADYWLDDGTYSLRLEYYEHTGDARILLWVEEVSEESEEPEADFDASPRSGPAPLEVEFDNDSQGDYDSCEWDFGDGDTDDDCDDPSHTYRDAGEYSVELTVSGPGGDDSKEKSEYITVYEPVQAKFRANPTHGVAPLTVNFTNRSSGDYDTCIWSLGDGTTFAGCGDFSHTYATAGGYTVSLTARGSGGRDTETRTNYITVSAGPQVNQPPQAAINGPTGALVGETVIFDSGGSYDPDGTIASYVWDFGDDGASDLAGLSSRSGDSTMAHSYSAPGTYQVTLAVTDDDGLSATAWHTLVVQEPETNQPPVAVLNGPATARVGETVTFDSSGSYDPDGTITSFVWDLGDSETARPGDSSVTHVYAAAGTYQVTLTVFDDGGLSDTASRMIVIEGLVVNQPPQAVINGPTQGLVGEALAFDGSSSSDPDGAIVGYTWAFGDGATSSGVHVSHGYTAAGNYNVTLTVTDDKGLSDISTYTLLIEQEEPAPSLEPPTPTPTYTPVPTATATGTAEPTEVPAAILMPAETNTPVPPIEAPTGTPTPEPATSASTPTPTASAPEAPGGTLTNPL